GSLHRGQTWSPAMALSSSYCNGARAAAGPDGELYVGWDDCQSRQVMGRRSDNFGTSFSAPFVVAPMLDNLGTKPIGYYYPPSCRMNPVYPTYNSAPDFPAIDVDRSSGPRRGTLYVTW